MQAELERKDEELAQKLQEEEREEEEKEKKKEGKRKGKTGSSSKRKKRKTSPKSVQAKRKKMVTFLKGTAGVSEKVLYRMKFENLCRMYTKEMNELKKNGGEITETSKSEKKRKGVEELSSEEKRLRLEQEQNKNRDLMNLDLPNESFNEEPQKEPEPVEVKGPEIVDWDIISDEKSKLYIRITRADKTQACYKTFQQMIRFCFRHDIEDMYEVSKKKYKHLINQNYHSMEEAELGITTEYLHMMFEPETKLNCIDEKESWVTRWALHENCGVYSVIMEGRRYEFYLVEKMYNHGLIKMMNMLQVTLSTSEMTEMAKDLVKKITKQVEEKKKEFKKT